jgi:hypothetical protein
MFQRNKRKKKVKIKPEIKNKRIEFIKEMNFTVTENNCSEIILKK